MQLFNELLVQYDRGENKRPGQVVPDNMIVIHDKPIVADLSYDVPIQPVPPFWVLDYLSKNSTRKDYLNNMEQYESELKIPYYMRYCRDTEDLTLFQLRRGKFIAVEPNYRGRLELPELELEMALLDGWVRFWHRAELLLLPGELLNAIKSEQEQQVHLMQEIFKVEQQIKLKDQQLLDQDRKMALLETELKRFRGET